MISDYEFRIYFLPVPAPGAAIAPNHWVQELKECCASAPTSTSVPRLDPATVYRRLRVEAHVRGDGLRVAGQDRALQLSPRAGAAS